MYEQQFGFTDRPFVVTPLVQRYVPITEIEEARLTLIRTVERAEGPAVLIGPTGTGKSLVCHMLAEHFRPTFHVAMLASARLRSGRELLQNVLYELGLPYQGMDEGELRLSLMDFLRPSASCPNGMLLLVDEAHTLPFKLLEEIRMITNLVRDGQPRIRLVMAGDRSLEEKLVNPKLDSFNQRIAARCYLESYNREQTIQYLESQLASVGGDATSLFDESAVTTIYRLTDGIPRLINQLADHTLILASVQQVGQISTGVVEEAWADLQQLPAPWQPSDEILAFEESDDEENAVIEFGQLSESENELKETQLFDVVLDDDPETQLDRISNHVDAASLEDPQSPNEMFIFGPMASECVLDLDQYSPEHEIVFHEATTVSENVFSDEEVVIDRYASLHAEQVRSFPQVTSIESREFALALNLLQSETSKTDLEPAIGESTTEVTIELDQHVDEFESSSANSEVPEDINEYPGTNRFVTVMDELDGWDPLVATQLNDHNFEVPVEPQAAPELEVATADTDDRDIIIVEDNDGQPRRKKVRTTVKPRRQEYRQLFAKLRRG